MSKHQPVHMEDVPDRVKEAFEGLGTRLGLIYTEASEKGLTDVVLQVLLIDQENARIRIVDRQVYQQEVLREYPRDSADPGSFFEMLNRSHDKGEGFWVILQTVGEKDEYLFRVSPLSN